MHPDSSTLSAPAQPWCLIGHSREILEVARQVETAARSRAGVLVIGEAGTGRGVLARAIHNAAAQSGAPFISVYCGAIEPGCAEAVLFGTPDGNGKKASQTQTHYERIWPNGLVSKAINGTLYLRMVEELPERTQAKLARILRDGEAVVGEGNAPRPISIQPITAADTDLTTLVRDGRIRPDLHKRLSAQQILIPPLRARRGDIPALADHLLDQACEAAGLEPKRLSPAAHALLSAMPWWGNARELDAALRKTLLQTAGQDVDLDAVLRQVHLDDATPMAPGIQVAGTLREARSRFEREYIAAVLAQHKGRIPEAARSLGIQRTNLYRKLRSLHLAKADHMTTQRS